MAKFKVGDKVRAIDNEYGITTLDNEWEGVVNSVQYDGLFNAVTTKGGLSDDVATSQEYDGLHPKHFELVTPSKSKKQRLTDAESEIAALKSQVSELTAKVAHFEQAIATANFRPYRDTVEKALTPNKQRKAIIAEAKAFVEDVTHRIGNGKSEYGEGNATFRTKRTIAKFHVNKEKRVVTALVYGKSSGRLLEKAIAKCAPDDVFNADIGKAIALGRALGLDVERFEQAVKPTEVVVGMDVRTKYEFGGYNDDCPTRVVSKHNGMPEFKNGTYSSHYEITDDTEAVY